jgi:hypothetical protein
MPVVSTPPGLRRPSAHELIPWGRAGTRPAIGTGEPESICYDLSQRGLGVKKTDRGARRSALRRSPSAPLESTAAPEGRR